MLKFINLLLFTFQILISIVSAQQGLTKGNQILPPIDILGNKFFNSKTNEQFFMKGIAYQPAMTVEEVSLLKPDDARFIDPLADETTCKRDIPLLAKLGVNVIRVYQIDVRKNHDFCMKQLAKNGIYVLADLSEPDLSVVREHPKFTTELFNRYIEVINVMSQYSNTLGYFAGNEVTNDRTTTLAAAFVKASVRDIKNYMAKAVHDGKIPRVVPVGYSTNDDPDVRLELMNYFICNSTPEESIDFYGVNIYEWCGYSSYVSSGYKERTEEHKNFPIPLFMSEFGCNAYRPRPFTEIEAIFSPVMSDVWSGGLVYMYFEEENQYGIVKRLTPSTVEILPEFANLEKQYNKVNVKGVSKAQYSSQLSTMSKPQINCPVVSTKWEARSDELPPTPNFEKCKCLEDLPCSISKPLQTKEMYKQPFDILCDIVDCSDIEYHNGKYGEYSDCSKREQLSYVMSKVYYYQNGEHGCPLLDILPEYVVFNSKYKNANEITEQDTCSIVAIDTKKRSIKKGDTLPDIQSPFAKTKNSNEEEKEEIFLKNQNKSKKLDDFGLLDSGNAMMKKQFTDVTSNSSSLQKININLVIVSSILVILLFSKSLTNFRR